MNSGELLAWAEERLPRLIDDVHAAVRARIGLYRDEGVVPPADLRASLAHTLGCLVGVLGGTEGACDLTVLDETGRRRARQGVPLPEVLQVHRIGCTMLWDLLADHARPGAVDVLVDLAGLLWRATDDHALRLTEAYRATSADLLVARQVRRSALVDALFTGQRVFDTGPGETGKLLGLPLDGKLVVVAAETTALAEESLVGVERGLAGSRIVSAWQLTPTTQAGVVSLRDDQYDTMLVVLREAAVARTGVSPLYRSLAETPHALHLARTALAGLRPGRRAVRAFPAIGGPSPV
ncbi:PucR family transcriptional regulator [Amycolatopsis sp. lyj-90]|uniref:PucR family transcriptional regulator n=1 Tax=Amycolatopsis sp. lyj-90 TaxID=2789285 RepID=UPI00397DCD64